MSVAPSIDYDGLVEKGAGLVHDGHLTVEDIEIPSRIEDEYSEPGFTVEELREDVQAYLDEHTTDPEPDAVDDNEERPVTDGVDWDGLWSTFGFDTPGSFGTYIATPLQLELPIEVSDQARGNPHDHIEKAVDEGYLARLTISGAHGEEVLRGYALQRGGGS